jgi:hypothetical protein
MQFVVIFHSLLCNSFGSFLTLRFHRDVLWLEAFIVWYAGWLMCSMNTCIIVSTNDMELNIARAVLGIISKKDVSRKKLNGQGEAQTASQR